MTPQKATPGLPKARVWLRHRISGSNRPWHFTFDYQLGRTACGVEIYRPRVACVRTDAPTENVCKKCLKRLALENNPKPVRICASCREEIQRYERKRAAKDGALFHVRCWDNT